MSWDGRVFCADDGCLASATYVVHYDSSAGTPYCKKHAEEFSPDVWTVDPLPDFAALRRDAETMAKVTEIVQQWLDEDEHGDCAFAAMAELVGELELISNA